MNSSKLKLILIFLFLAVDLFFLSELINLKSSKEAFSENEIAEAVEVLETKGVLIEPTTVVNKKTVPDMLKLNFETEAVEKLVKNIMREDYSSYKIPDGQNFANDAESFSIFFDYTFEYQLFSYELNRAQITNILKYTNTIDNKLQKNYEKILEKLFGKLNLDKKSLSANVKKLVTVDGLDYVEAVQCIDGNEVLDATFYAVFSDKELVYIAGTFYYSDRVSAYSTDALNGINVLFSLGKRDAEITDMQLVYLPVYESTSSFYLTPSYRFEYSDGSVEVYDATSGVKRKYF
jgi:hypothetical protein